MKPARCHSRESHVSIRLSNNLDEDESSVMNPIYPYRDNKSVPHCSLSDLLRTGTYYYLYDAINQFMFCKKNQSEVDQVTLRNYDSKLTGSSSFAPRAKVKDPVFENMAVGPVH